MRFVVAADDGTGATWAGATEALERRYAPVGVWVGAGASDGNHALVRRGAIPITDPSKLFEIGPLRTGAVAGSALLRRRSKTDAPDVRHGAPWVRR